MSGSRQPVNPLGADFTMADSSGPSTVKSGDAQEPEHINIKVTHKNTEVFFKIGSSTALKKLVEAFCERQGVVLKSVRFLFDGVDIVGADTPSGIGMADGDTIEVRSTDPQIERLKDVVETVKGGSWKASSYQDRRRWIDALHGKKSSVTNKTEHAIDLDSMTDTPASGDTSSVTFRGEDVMDVDCASDDDDDDDDDEDYGKVSASSQKTEKQRAKKLTPVQKELFARLNATNNQPKSAVTTSMENIQRDLLDLTIETLQTRVKDLGYNRQDIEGWAAGLKEIEGFGAFVKALNEMKELVDRMSKIELSKDEGNGADDPDFITRFRKQNPWAEPREWPVVNETFIKGHEKQLEPCYVFYRQMPRGRPHWYSVEAGDMRLLGEI